MKYKIVIAFVVLLTFFCKTAIAQKRLSNYECRISWQYFDIEHSVTGMVISHEKPRSNCGYLISASITIVKIYFGDTIRVLELCNTEKTFLKGDIIKIEPAKKPEFDIDLPNQFYCSIKKTTFGIITGVK